MLRESNYVSRLTVAGKNLILHLSTTQGTGVGSRTADEQYITHKYICIAHDNGQCNECIILGYLTIHRVKYTG